MNVKLPKRIIIYKGLKMTNFFNWHEQFGLLEVN
jgi:hypothetical protein